MLQEELHTSSVRVFKKFRGNAVLKVPTLSRHSKPGLEQRPQWHQIHLRGYEALQRSVITKPLEELRSQFLVSTCFEIHESLSVSQEVDLSVDRNPIPSSLDARIIPLEC